ncbi:MAG: hypothetical protein ABI579_02500 [Candidatus Sumerlaeota bacterium]
MLNPDENTAEEEQPVPGIVRSFFGRYRHWLVPLGKLGSGQALTTLMSGLFGLLIVPNIEKKEFALYTLFASLQQTISSFSDMGIGHAVIAVGAKYRNDQGLFAHLMQTIKVYRERLFAGSLLLGLILSSQIFTKHDEPIIRVLLCLALTATTAWVIIHNQMINGVLYLEERFNVVSFVVPRSATIKLVLLFFCLATHMAGVIALLSINLIAESITHFQFRKYFKFPPRPPHDEGNAAIVRDHVKRYVRPMVAGSILFAIQAPLILWVLNGMGSSGDVANYGAISRLGQITNFVTYLCTTLVITRMAKVDSRDAAKRLMLKLTIAQVAVLASVVSVATLFTAPLLHLLGPKYSSLHTEFHYFLASWTLWHLSSFFFMSLTGQGISKYQGVVNFFAITVQIASIFIIGVTSARTAFTLNIIYSSTMLLGQMSLVYMFMIRKPVESVEQPLEVKKA